MGRVNVFLSDQLLEEINQHAKEEGSNRSALIRAAVEKYIDAKRRDREEEEKRKEDAGGFPQNGCVDEEVGGMGSSSNDPKIS